MRDSARSEIILLIAGGVGIAPLMSMIETFAAEADECARVSDANPSVNRRLKRKVSMIYSVQDEREILFLRRLEDICTKFGPDNPYLSVDVQCFVTRYAIREGKPLYYDFSKWSQDSDLRVSTSQDGNMKRYYGVYITERLISDLLSRTDASSDNTAVYMCGPESLERAVHGILRKLEFPMVVAPMETAPRDSPNRVSRHTPSAIAKRLPIFAISSGQPNVAPAQKDITKPRQSTQVPKSLFLPFAMVARVAGHGRSDNGATGSLQNDVASLCYPSDAARIGDNFADAIKYKEIGAGAGSKVDDLDEAGSIGAVNAPKKTSAHDLSARDSQTTIVGDSFPSNPEFGCKMAKDSPKGSPGAAVSLSSPGTKKVNFWGWVDVGFSHSVDDYDRKPIAVEPLTKDGAVEVMEMRMAMKRVSDEMTRSRAAYESNFPAFNTSLRSPLPVTVTAAECIGLSLPNECTQQSSPRARSAAVRDSLSLRFQQLGLAARRARVSPPLTAAGGIKPNTSPQTRPNNRAAADRKSATGGRIIAVTNAGDKGGPVANDSALLRETADSQRNRTARAQAWNES
ncbi:hypothetical protein HDU82_006747 [Entophlyctis luteolus]|nr:hypothetical protein HDU82_006747 [Entophlyctis luteolus]